MAERDYPEGHPASSDYKGQAYTPPRAPWSEDFPPNHPAREGKNIKPADTPDGLRAQQLEREHKQQSSEAKQQSAPDEQEGG